MATATPDQRRLLELCAARLKGDESAETPDWSVIAREAARPGGLELLEEGRTVEQSDVAARTRALLRRVAPHRAAATERVDEELEAAAAVGARLVTVLDDGYPANLRLIWNLPPFLFLLGGELAGADLCSVAVVGTRDATDAGISKARRIAHGLADEHVTVISGLARGIDTAAHTATLESGGRTIAVIGTGVTRTYPAENQELADRIVAAGGVIASQFWPSSPPARWTFPRRNVVMSGMAQGTVVVEASSTSGAKMQARLATEHGKQVFLLRSLTTSQKWAKSYVDKRGAIEVDHLEDILRHLASPERITAKAMQRQLTLDLA